jgi:hypothetical protein
LLRTWQRLKIWDVFAAVPVFTGRNITKSLFPEFDFSGKIRKETDCDDIADLTNRGIEHEFATTDL